MKNNPLILALWAIGPFLLLSVTGWSANETLKPAFKTTYNCTMSITAIPNGVFCGETHGSIDVKITGGTAPYTIEWDNNDSSIWAETTTNENTFNIPNLPKGRYLVKVRDANGCRDMVMNIDMDVNASDLTYTIEPSDPCDANGSMIIRVSGSSPPYWVILDGPTSGGVIANDNAFRIDNLLGGNYTITVDKDGCGHSQTTTLITTPEQLMGTATAVDYINSCDGFGDVQLTLNGGTPDYAISWYGPTTGFTRATSSKLVQNLVPGDYTFVIKDANNCSVTATATVVANGSTMSASLTQTPVECDNMGQIGVAISGGDAGYSVAYSGPVSGTITASNNGRHVGTASILDLPPGDYSITVTDSKGCSDTKSITVGGEMKDVSCIVTQTPVECDNMGQIGVAISGGNPTFRVDYSGPKSGSIIATTTGERTALASILDLPAGNYTIVVTDSRGCSASESVEVTGALSDMSTIVKQTPVECDNMGQIGVAISGGDPTYRIDYSGPISGAVIATTTGTKKGTGTILDLPAGNYTVVVTDSRGCSDTKHIEVTGALSDMSTIVKQTPVECDNMGQIGVAISGGDPTYRIDYSGPVSGALIATTTGTKKGTGTILDLPAGNYTVVVTDSRGCSDTKHIEVTGSISDMSMIVTQTPVECDNMGQIGVTISGGDPTYRIDYSGPVRGAMIATTTGTKKGTGTILDLPAGNYTVVVTDSRGCSDTESITVTGSISDMSMIVTQTPVECDDMGQVGVVINGGKPTYRIDYSGPVSGAVIATTTGANSGTGAILDLPVGDYTIIVTDSRGCSDTKTITVDNIVSDLACVLNQTPQICDNMGGITVGISGGYPAYRIDYSGPTSGAVIATTTGNRAGTANIRGLSAGTYTITVSDSRGCSASESINVGGGTSDIVCTVGEQSEVCENTAGLDIGVKGGTPAYTISYTGPVSGSYISTDGATQFVSLPLGSYTIVVTDANGCSTTESATVGTGVNDLHCKLVRTPQICHKLGTIEVIISGGKPGFTVKWSNGHDEKVGTTTGYNYKFEVPSPDVYTITVIDANGCVVSESAEVVELANNLAFEVFSYARAQDGDGQIEVYFQSGQAPYTISLTGPLNRTKITNGATVFNNLPNGYYSVHITDANGCSKQIDTSIQPQGPDLDGMKIGDSQETTLEAEKIATKEVQQKEPTNTTVTLSNELIKEEFKVYQNYPNPFNRRTTIGFDLPKDMKVTLIIQDYLGQTINVLERDFSQGFNEYEFNQQNLKAGVYYYTISAGKYVKTNRMLLID